MKFIWLVLFSFVLFSYDASASYCPNVNLNSQTAIDNFAINQGCDSIGSLTISASGVADLTGLSILRHVGSFILNSDVSDFSPLVNLEAIDLFIIRGELPNEFMGFPPSEIGSILVQFNNLKNFDGLDSLKQLSRLEVSHCSNLESLKGLGSLEYLESLKISSSNKIKNISLPSMIEIDRIEIDNCAKMFRISNLGSVEYLNSLRLQQCAEQGSFDLDHTLKGVVGEGIYVFGCQFEEINFNHVDTVTKLTLSANNRLKEVRFNSLPENSGAFDVRLFGNDSLARFTFGETTNVRNINYFSADTDFELDFLSDLEYFNSLIIEANSMVVWPFEDIILGGYLSLVNCTQLSDCCVLYDQINENKIRGFGLFQNGGGCADIAQLSESCGLSVDADEDTVMDDVDNCPDDSNAGQEDLDGDGIGDVCDNCPEIANADQLDGNSNGVGDACEDAEYDTKLHAENGDVLVESSSGLILKGIDGNCYRIIVDGDGGLRTSMIPCPTN